jgi:hypothetical protein
MLSKDCIVYVIDHSRDRKWVRDIIHKISTVVKRFPWISIPRNSRKDGSGDSFHSLCIKI